MTLFGAGERRFLVGCLLFSLLWQGVGVYLPGLRQCLSLGFGGISGSLVFVGLVFCFESCQVWGCGWRLTGFGVVCGSLLSLAL